MALNQYTPEEPISSIATALAPAALGIVRVSGKNCIQLVSKVFSRPKALLEAPGNTLVYGWIINPAVPEPVEGPMSSAVPEPVEGQKIDEVLCAVYRAPKSYTGEDMVEIFCHGGPSVVTAIQNLMLKSGFRQANRGEYTFRAYINGKTDLTRAEAVKEIIDSHTDDSRSHAAGRLAGNLFNEIDSIKELIVKTLASIEVEIEYPEDEETISDTFDKAELEQACNRLQTLVDSWKGEKLYQDGARVVLAGRTNAGKSSLFNAILKEERAIVSDIEGTTRDWLESWTGINGIPVRLFDTAGLRQTQDIIEAKGVEISHSLVHDADVVLYLIDSTQGMNDEDQTFIASCEPPLIIVWTKCDMPSSAVPVLRQAQEPQASIAVPEPAEGPMSSAVPEPVEGPSSLRPSAKRRGSNLQLSKQVPISVKTGSNLSLLYTQIEQILKSGLSTDRTQAGLGSARQKESVAEALERTRHALAAASDNYSLDAVVQDLEDALDSLAEVTGAITPDDVLGTIFANFCVGK
ncbi:MAG: tRNA uridine-5-carboxymethylaminomethyl(34) synthesis GTPase MnmE [Treponema sp.]|nr:tRNA uridine-5-carboxymethylaminomethyl(34) synthesis GTPase MnmE [Treponema sp.]